ncbi:MAG: prolipoprotein diacylglyceryl transferase [Christensenellales bacterium]
MSKKLDELKRSQVTILGYTFKTKTFITTITIALAVLLLLVALTLLGVEISWYGVLFGLGFLSALCLAGQNCKLRDVDPEFPYTLVWFVFPLSILGARLYYLAFHGGIGSFADIFRLWEGGLAIYGGVIGGLLGLIICCLIKKVNIVSTTDAIAPLLSLGQFFGRIGCIFGHCCYGVEVTNKALQWFPIAINISGTYHYATNFYESILNLVLFFVLTTLLRKTKIKGLTTCGYLVGYGVIRFVLEAFRAEEQTLYIGNYPVSQLVSIICVLIGVIGICTLLIVNNRRKENSTNV